MPSPSQFLLDFLEFRPHAVASGLPVKQKVALDRPAADEGEPQEPLGPVDKPRPDADASEQDESHEAGGKLIISGGDAALLLEMPNEALNP